MPDLFLDWTAYGTVNSGLTTPTTVDAGGVAVTATYTAQDEGAGGFITTTENFVDTGEPFDTNSSLKLFGEGGEGGTDATSTLVLDFASADPLYSDSVQSVSFRLNDIDAGIDPENAGGSHLDGLTVLAFDALGNPVPVTITAGSDVTVSGAGVTGGGTGGEAADADNSALVEIAGPVARIEILYTNGGDNAQTAFVTDVHFSTIDATDPGTDGIVFGTDDGDLIDVDYDGDPTGDFVDSGDNIFPGGNADDDIIIAGDGDDTVVAGDDDDSVLGGDGSDELLGGDGNDTIVGGATFLEGALPDLAYPGQWAADADPENDRDFIDGGAGADVIFGGDDADTIVGGEGSDTIDGGIDADDIDGGSGRDSIIGGEGSDTINAGSGDDIVYGGVEPTTPDLDAINLPDDDGDLVTNNGQDLIDGEAGNDTIFGQDDDDTLIGGSGDDLLDGGIDEDELYGGADGDTLLGGDGDDTLDGGSGDDSLEGGSGDDQMQGGSDGDTLIGGDGNDTLNGGTGDDLLQGGADRDVFQGADAGDTIEGGSAGDDFDTLRLAPGDWRLADVVTDSDGNGIDGTIEWLDGSGAVTGTTTFTNIEEIVPCFTPGSLVATPQGARLVEELREGDKVITRDNGIQEIRWIGARQMNGVELAKDNKLQPILIRKGALGNGLPERDMMVSPNHRMLVTNEKVSLYFNETEVLAAAKHLVGLPGVHRINAMSATYIHFMFDRHEVVLADGAWSESFHPGDYSLKGIGREQRDEIFTLFPELKTAHGLENYHAARKSLKKHEAQLITLFK